MRVGKEIRIVSLLAREPLSSHELELLNKIELALWCSNPVCHRGLWRAYVGSGDLGAGLL